MAIQELEDTAVVDVRLVRRGARRTCGRRSGGRARLAGCAALTLTSLLAAIGWWRTINTPPMMLVPDHALPHPNARDYFIQAGNSIVDSNKLVYLIALRHPGAASGVLDYSTKAKAAVILKNRPALTTLRTGLAYAYVEPPLRSAKISLNEYLKFRLLARLLALEIQVRAEQGDWQSAMQCRLDTLQMAEAIPRGGTLLGYLVGAECQTIGRNARADIVEHLNANQSRAAIRRLQRILAGHTPYADILQEEKYAGQAMLAEMFREPQWRAEYSASMGRSTDPERAGFHETIALLHKKARIYCISERATYSAYTAYMDRAIENARLPYADSPPLARVPEDPICEAVLPILAKSRMKDAETMSQNARLVIALALHAYSLEHGRFPARLDALVPGYLDRLPADPMAVGGGTFGYEGRRHDYRLLSNNLDIQPGR